MRFWGAVFCFSIATSLFATEAKVVGDQLILSGRASGNELQLVRDAIAEHGDRIKFVILRDHSGRTENDDLYRIAEIIADRGWHTAVSGFCGTACSKIFLGGVQRHFTDDKSPAQTSLMFGSTNYSQDPTTASSMNKIRATSSPRGNYKFQDWMKARTGNQISQATLNRLFVDTATVYLHFYDSKRLGRKDGVSVLYCDGKERASKRWEECEKIADTDIYKEGILTSSELIRTNDRKDAKQ